MSVFVQFRFRRCFLQIKDVVLDGIGRTMNGFHSPAVMQPFEYVDPVTDETLDLYTNKRLSVLCIGDRRYYFDRITGKFDGVLSSMVEIAGRIELAD